jgi:hypothetical protein
MVALLVGLGFLRLRECGGAGREKTSRGQEVVYVVLQIFEEWTDPLAARDQPSLCF